MKPVLILMLILFPTLTACHFTSSPEPTLTPEPPTATPIIPPTPATADFEYWPAEPLGRQYYASIDINSSWKQAFYEAYYLAVEKDEDWVKSPIDVALRFSGYPNPDNLPPSNVFAYYIESTNKAVVVVRSGIAMDDSIYMTEHRVDLSVEEGVWMIEWAGFRQRCQRPSISDWTTELCP